MGTSVQTGRTATQDHPLIAALVAWLRANRQKALYIAAIVVIGVGLFLWNGLSGRQTEQEAGRRLGQARLAFESKNYPLAASELAQVTENFSGTRAAQQAVLLLAQTRLLQGQSQQAIDVLKRSAPDAGRDFRAQAYGLLGAAYENAAHPKEAAEAYRSAADAAQFPFLKAQFLSDAGRAWTAAGDTVQALEAYRAITSLPESTSTVIEARVRIGELTRGAAGTVK